MDQKEQIPSSQRSTAPCLVIPIRRPKKEKKRLPPIMAGVSYSKLIDMLHKANIELDRKILSDLAHNHPKVFKKIVDSSK